MTDKSMTYRDAITQSMESLAEDPLVRFIGYNLKHGSRGYKTLREIDDSKIIEMPVAESLMTGMSIGMAIGGFKPVLIYERHDFILNALDALVNHLDKLPELSHGQYDPGMIIRAVVGRTNPIDPGPQHKQDFSNFLKSAFRFPVYDPKNADEVLECYEKAKTFERPCMFIERSGLYKIWGMD